jgi:hypothetical protein
MKLPPLFPKKTTLATLTGALMALALLPGCNKTARPAAPGTPKPAAGGAAAAASTTAGSRTDLAAEFVSVFNDSPHPGNKGRDPFNPNSHALDPAPPPPSRPGSPTGLADPQLRLFGVVGSSKRWLATINNHVFEVKEKATITVPGGKVTVQVVEIGSNYADVMVEGNTVTKRLTLSKEK